MSDRQWKAKVRKYLHDAALVVLRLGDTEACWWELEQARKQVPPERLLLLVPAGADADALRPVIERATGAWRPPGINLLRVIVLGGLGLWLIAMAVLAVAALAGWVDL